MKQTFITTYKLKQVLVSCLLLALQCCKDDEEPAATMPVLLSFSPLQGFTGDVVTLTGTGFSKSTGVVFNTTAAVVLEQTATLITVQVPEGASTGKITLTQGDQSVTSVDDFTVTFGAPPLIENFEPESGRTGEVVIVRGTNFSPTPSSNLISFNGVTGIVTSVNEAGTELTTSVPTGTTTGKITVNIFGQTAVSPINFLYITPEPIITSVTILDPTEANCQDQDTSPTEITGNVTLTITGANFNPDVNGNVVKVGGLVATRIAASATTLIVQTPTNITSGEITVKCFGQTVQGPTLPVRTDNIWVEESTFPLTGEFLNRPLPKSSFVIGSNVYLFSATALDQDRKLTVYNVDNKSWSTATPVGTSPDPDAYFDAFLGGSTNTGFLAPHKYSTAILNDKAYIIMLGYRSSDVVNQNPLRSYVWQYDPADLESGPGGTWRRLGELPLLKAIGPQPKQIYSKRERANIFAIGDFLYVGGGYDIEDQTAVNTDYYRYTLPDAIDLDGSWAPVAFSGDGTNDVTPTNYVNSLLPGNDINVAINGKGYCGNAEQVFEFSPDEGTYGTWRLIEGYNPVSPFDFNNFIIASTSFVFNDEIYVVGGRANFHVTLASPFTVIEPTLTTRGALECKSVYYASSSEVWKYNVTTGGPWTPVAPFGAEEYCYGLVGFVVDGRAFAGLGTTAIGTPSNEQRSFKYRVWEYKP